MEERAGDDEVFGEAVPLVTEWRYQHAQFKEHWPQLEGLEAEVWMLELEIELIEEWELTLPPGRLAWEWDQRRRELRRRSQRLATARSNLGPVHSNGDVWQSGCRVWWPGQRSSCN